MAHTEHARITVDGTVLLGSLLACDGHDHFRWHSVFSHIHEDHVGKHLSACLYNGHVYASRETIELLEAIHNDDLKRRKNVHVLPMNEPYTIQENNDIEILRLIESSHVLGAAQVEVLNKDNKKFVYTGDITVHDVPPDNIDTLIMDSTHGSPQFDVSAEEESIRNRFVEKAAHNLKNEVRPVVIHAHRGTLQDLMGIVSSESELNSYKFLAPTKDVAASKIYKRYKHHGMKQIIDDESEEGLRIKEGEFPWIQFTASASESYGESVEGHYGLYFHSYNGGNQMREEENRTHFLENSHAPFSHLVAYVAQAKPHTIVVDNFRTRQGEKFAKELKGRGYNVVCQP